MPTKPITVVATGSPVPYERDPRRTIGDKPITLLGSTYYTRRIARGELKEVAAPEGAPAPKAEAAPAPKAGPAPAASSTPTTSTGKAS